MTSPRDSQRQRLYSAEDRLHRNVSKAAQRFLVKGKKVEGTGNVHIEACQSYIDHVTTAAWFQSRWGRRHLTARHKVYGRATASHYGNHISLPPWSRNEGVILHEIAHHLVSNLYADHGPEFAGVLLTLVRYQMGADAAKDLRESYKKHRVRYNLKAVPKPGTVKTVVPRTQIEAAAKRRQREVAARERQEQDANRARLHRERTSHHGRKVAAASIRECVKAGMLGPVGSATRKQALATARALEKAVRPDSMRSVS